MKLKLKTLGLAVVLTILVAAPVLADGGKEHTAFPYGTYLSKPNVVCQFANPSGDLGYGPEHTVSVIVTHNESANQTYALSACGCNGRYVQTRVELNGHMKSSKINFNYAQTLSACDYGQLTAYEAHKIEEKKSN